MERQQGTAQLIVLIFGIATLAVVFLLLDFSVFGEKQAQTEREGKALTLVMDTGIANAIEEMRNDDDVEGDGLGFLGTGLGTAAGGGFGVPVIDASGSTVGYYRTTVEEVPGVNDHYYLTAVAATPDLQSIGVGAADRNRRVKAAKLEIEVYRDPFAFLGDRNAFTADGELSGNPDLSMDIDDPTNWTVQDTNDEVPAVNISDSTFKSEWIDEFVAEDSSDTSAAVIEGASLSNPGTGGSDLDSIEERQGGAVTAAKLAIWEDRIVTYVTTSTMTTVSGNNNGGKRYGSGPVTTSYIGDDIYLMENIQFIEEDHTVEGTGTLIITQGFNIRDGGALNWTGDVIVYAHDDNVAMEVGKGSGATSGGSMSVTGNLVFLAGGGTLGADDGNKATFRVVGGGDLYVNGSLLAFAPTGSVIFNVDDNTESSDPGTVVIDGLLAVLGNQIDFWVEGGNNTGPGGEEPSLTVNGMTAFGIIEGGRGVKKLRFTKESTTTMSFDNAKLDAAIESIQDLIDKVDIPTDGVSDEVEVYRWRYVEGGWNYLMEQETIVHPVGP